MSSQFLKIQGESENFQIRLSSIDFYGFSGMLNKTVIYLRSGKEFTLEGNQVEKIDQTILSIEKDLQQAQPQDKDKEKVTMMSQ